MISSWTYDMMKQVIDAWWNPWMMICCSCNLCQLSISKPKLTTNEASFWLLYSWNEITSGSFAVCQWHVPRKVLPFHFKLLQPFPRHCSRPSPFRRCWTYFFQYMYPPWNSNSPWKLIFGGLLSFEEGGPIFRGFVSFRKGKVYNINI